MSPDGASRPGSAANALLLAAAFVIVIAGLRAAEAIVVPFLVSAFIAVLCAPPLFWLERRGTPRLIAMLLVLGLVAAVGAALSAIVGSSIQAFTADLPWFRTQLVAKAQQVLELAASYGLPVEVRQLIDALDPGALAQMVGDVFNGFGGVLANAFLIFWTVVFILFEAHSFPGKLRATIARSDAPLERFSQFSSSIMRYLLLKSIISIGTGVGIAMWCHAFDLKYPMLWGMLAFVLNYVPNIGSIIAAVPAVLFALVQLDFAGAGWILVGYVIVNVLFGNIIEPRFMGRGLGLSTLVVFLSLVFWGWVLGPVGMFLSVPLTMTARVALDAWPDTRWIAVLLGPESDHYRPLSEEVLEAGRAIWRPRLATDEAAIDLPDPRPPDERPPEGRADADFDKG